MTGAVGENAAAKIKAFHDVYNKFETNLPNKWDDLEFREKVALTSYLMIKKEVSLFKKYLSDISQDPKSNALLSMLMCYLVATFKNEESRELMKYIKNLDFLASQGESL